ncbi:hypothetical protein KI387_006557, partial [Taxus chinensis]
MAEQNKFRVKKFEDQNYQLWKIWVEDYLYQKDLYLPLRGEEVKPSIMSDEEWKVLDRNDLAVIRLSLALSLAS